MLIVFCNDWCSMFKDFLNQSQSCFFVESFFVCRDADVCKFCELSVDTDTNAKQADLLIAQAPEVRSAVNLYFQFSCLVNLDFFSPETVFRCLYALLVNE